MWRGGREGSALRRRRRRRRPAVREMKEGQEGYHCEGRMEGNEEVREERVGAGTGGVLREMAEEAAGSSEAGRVQRKGVERSRR